MPITQDAYVFVEDATESSDWAPAELTAQIGVRPTSSNVSSSGRRCWLYEAPTSTSLETASLLLELLRPFSPSERRLRDFVRGHRLRSGVNVRIRMFAEPDFAASESEGWGVPTPSLHFPAELLGQLSVMGLSLDLDQYVWTPEDVRQGRT